MSSHLLKTIRFDGSDTHAYPLAAAPDEWAISGAFAFSARPADDIKGKVKQAFANGFLGLSSFGYATFAAVSPMSRNEREAVVDRLAQHLMDVYQPPSQSEARRAAIEEVAFIEELVAGSLVNTLFCVSREVGPDGQITELFRKLERRIDGGPIYLAEDGPSSSVHHPQEPSTND